MGDRICLTFTDGDERSPCLYAHWMGQRLLDKAAEFHAKYCGEIRSEPSNWMVNFISWLRKGAVEDGEYYLYPDEEHSCTPDDNGYWEMDTVTGEIREA